MLCCRDGPQDVVAEGEVGDDKERDERDETVGEPEREEPDVAEDALMLLRLLFRLSCSVFNVAGVCSFF